MTAITLAGMAVAGPLAVYSLSSIPFAEGALTLSALSGASSGVIATGGSSIGGTLSAYVGYSYLSNVKGFSIEKVRSGREPSIITVNGFLSENDDGLGEWEKALSHKYKENAWYHLKWESKSLKKLGSFITKNCLNFHGMKKFFGKVAQTASKQAYKKLGPAATLIAMMQLATNPWHVALKKAEQTGIILADIISRCKNKEFILMGNSLGARVVYNSLYALSCAERRNVHSAHLLGGAVDSDTKKWAVAKRSVSSEIYNYHSGNDYVLKCLYSVGTFFASSPVGRNIIGGVSGVNNVNVTDYVSGHMHYKKSAGECSYLC